MFNYVVNVTVQMAIQINQNSDECFNLMLLEIKYKLNVRSEIA